MRVSDIMTGSLDLIRSTDSIAHAALRMAKLDALMSRERIRRMPVCSDYREVVGIVALADRAAHAPVKKEVAETLADICAPGGIHCRTQHPVEVSFEEMVK